MNVSLTLHVLGGLLLFLAATLLTPIPVSFIYGDREIFNFLLSALITGAIGYALFRRFRGRGELTLREGFAVVSFGWIAFALFGGLPYLFAGTLPSLVDSFFEAMSGFTTVGATVIGNVEAVPKSVLFWRALTQWLGGMGFIVLGVAILPLLGIGGMQLYEAEAPGLATDRLTPRIQDTARLLWGVYALITAIGIVLLWVGEMDLFDATCHTFTAVATGGFSTRNQSLDAFGSYSQIVIIGVMIAGGANFYLHYFALLGRGKTYWQSEEFRLYIGLIAGVSLIIFCCNWSAYDGAEGSRGNWVNNLLDATFTVTSILTTTGFATADYELWPQLVQGLLFLLMFNGACTGSTAGGLKLVRVVLLLKHAYLQTVQLIHPRQVLALKLDRQPVTPDVMQDVLGFTVLYMGVYVVAALLVTATGIDLLTAGSGTIACLGTIGPGLADVGPFDNYFHLPSFAKIVLSFVMLLGRLEISTVLVLLFVSVWKK